MKLKTLLIVVALLAALSGAAWFLNRSTPPPSLADARIGQPILSTAAAEKAARVRISEKGKSVLLVRDTDAGWRVSSYHDLPADFAKLATLVKSLNSAKIERLVTSSPDRLQRLEFSDTTITVLDSSEKPLLALTLGKSADTGGRYLRFGDENKAYLARLDTWLDVEPKNWADATLAKFTPADIAKVTLTFPSAPAVTVTRASATAAFIAETTPAGQRLKTETIPSLLSTLSSLRFTETSATDDPQAVGARAAALTVTLTTFDGKTLTFALGRQPERSVVKPEALKPAPTALVSGEPKPAPTDLLSTFTEKLSAGPVFAFITHSDASATVNTLMQKRAFQIAEYALNSLPASPSALFEALPPPPARPPENTTP
jgi:hypothetical protein